MAGTEHVVVRLQVPAEPVHAALAQRLAAAEVAAVLRVEPAARDHHRLRPAVVHEHRGQVRGRAVVDRHPQVDGRRAAEPHRARECRGAVDQAVGVRGVRVLDQDVVRVQLAAAVDEALPARPR
jgi:hypothetical protein